MFCPNCGTNNPDGSKFCSECGTVFESVNASGADTPAPTVDEILGEIKSEPVAAPAPVEPEQPAPVEPEQPAPVEPEQPAPVELAKPAPEPAPAPVPEPVPEQTAPQVTAPVQPAAPTMPQQPMPQYQQPAAPAAPVAPKPPKPPRKPLDAKQKKQLIIGGSCGAVLIVFLIVLFAAIIPHAGLKGKLRYSWTCVGASGWTSSTGVLDFKKKVWTIGKDTYKINKVQTKDNRVAIYYTDVTSGFATDSDTAVFVVAFSPDGKKLYLFEADGYSDGDRPDFVFSRDKKEIAAANIGGSIDDLLW